MKINKGGIDRKVTTKYIDDIWHIADVEETETRRFLGIKFVRHNRTEQIIPPESIHTTAYKNDEIEIVKVSGFGKREEDNS